MARKISPLLLLGVASGGLLLISRTILRPLVAVPSIDIAPNQKLAGTITWQQTGVNIGNFALIIQYESTVGAPLWRTVAQSILNNISPGSFVSDVPNVAAIESNEPLGVHNVRARILDPISGFLYSEAVGTINIVSGLAAQIISVALRVV